MNTFEELKRSLKLLEKRIVNIQQNCPVYKDAKVDLLLKEKEGLLNQLLNLQIERAYK